MTLRDIRWPLLVALLLRSIWGVIVPVMPVSDSFAYDTFARNLAEHGVFGWTGEEPAAFWPPGTTFFHASLYFLFGSGYAPIVGANILLSLGILVVTARLAARFVSAAAAVASAWIVALWPTLVMYVTVLASELPFALLTAAALDVWTSPKMRGAWKGLIAGVLLGAAALVRPLALLLPITYAFAIVVSSRDLAELRRQCVIAVVSIIAMAATIAPWTMRNHRLFGEMVLISTNGGITFWMGNAPGTDGGYLPLPPELKGETGPEEERLLRAEAWQYIKSEPSAFAVRTLMKALKLYANESIGVVWNEPGIAKAFGGATTVSLKRFTQISWGLFVIAGVFGISVLLRRRGFWSTVTQAPMVAIAYFTVVHAVTVSQDRYHLSFCAFLAIYIGSGFDSARHLLSIPSAQRRRR